jgi:SAM-dependent methyltransferase
MSQEPGYIHGYSDAEAQRLIAQAEFLAPWVFDGIALDGVRTLYEVGIGVGAQTRRIRRRWPQVRVVGVDISEGQIAHARRVLAEDIAAGGVELVCASATDTPLPTASADAAFVCFVLEHVPDPVAVLRECARVVRPGGQVFAVDVYHNSVTIEPRHGVIERFWAGLSETLRRCGGHPNVGARLGALGAAAGLEVVSHRFVPMLGDARDPERRRAILRFFRGLCKAVESQIRAAGAFDEDEVDALWAAWDVVEGADDALFCHALAHLEARIR